jgi:competence ComEA-like helix-hairpin-helix protein
MRPPPSPVRVRLAALALVVALALLSLPLSRRPAAPRAAPPPAPAALGAPAAATLLFGGRLDLNQATAEDLAALPGIGPERARRIVETRAERGGRFERVSELLDVPGIGPKTLARLRAHVTVGAGDAPTE